MRFSCCAAFCLGLVFPALSLRLSAADQNTPVVLPSGVLNEARSILQRGCGSECLKVGDTVFPSFTSMPACMQVLDTFAVQQELGNSSAVVSP